VKIFGDELESLLSLPRVSWTHLEELSRVADPEERKNLLAAVQAEGLSSNETRQKVTDFLGNGTVAPGPVSLPKLSGSAKNLAAQDMTFRSLMVMLTKWGSAAAAEIRSIGTLIGPNGHFAACDTDIAHASDAGFELGNLLEAVQELRALLSNSIPSPEPKKPDLIQEESIPEISGGRVLDI
jgi:hypothetical protein